MVFENQLIKHDIILLVREIDFFLFQKKKKILSFEWKNSSIGCKSLDKITNKTSSLIIKMYNLRELGKLFKRLKKK